MARAFRDGDGVTPNLERAAHWYRRAALQGGAAAQAALGQRYARGEGVRQDIQKALYWTSLAARSGLARAVETRAAMVQTLDPDTVRRVDLFVSQFRPLASQQ